MPAAKGKCFQYQPPAERSPSYGFRRTEDSQFAAFVKPIGKLPAAPVGARIQRQKTDSARIGITLSDRMTPMQCQVVGLSRRAAITSLSTPRLRYRLVACGVELEGDGLAGKAAMLAIGKERCAGKRQGQDQCDVKHHRFPSPTKARFTCATVIRKSLLISIGRRCHACGPFPAPIHGSAARRNCTESAGSAETRRPRDSSTWRGTRPRPPHRSR